MLHQDVEMRLEGFRVNHVAATNATTTTGFKSASRILATTALNPIAWLGACFDSNTAAPDRDDQQHDERGERKEYPESDHLECSQVLLRGTTAKN